MAIDYNKLNDEDKQFLTAVIMQGQNDALVSAGYAEPTAYINKEASYHPDVVAEYERAVSEATQEINQMHKTASECEDFVGDIYLNCYNKCLVEKAAEWETRNNVRK